MPEELFWGSGLDRCFGYWDPFSVQAMDIHPSITIVTLTMNAATTTESTIKKIFSKFLSRTASPDSSCPVLSVEEEAVVSKGGTHDKSKGVTRDCGFYTTYGMPRSPSLSSCSPQAASKVWLKRRRKAHSEMLLCSQKKLLLYWGMKKVEKQMASMRSQKEDEIYLACPPRSLRCCFLIGSLVFT